MATANLQIEVKISWWFTPYVGLLLFFCVLMQREPDPEKLMRVIVRALRWRGAGGRWKRFTSDQESRCPSPPPSSRP